MNAGAKLALFAVGLVVAFAGSFGFAHLVIPASLAESWIEQSHSGQHEEEPMPAMTPTPTPSGSR